MKLIALMKITMTDRPLFNEEVGIQTLQEALMDALDAMEIAGCELVMLEMQATRKQSLARFARPGYTQARHRR